MSRDTKAIKIANTLRIFDNLSEILIPLSKVFLHYFSLRAPILHMSPEPGQRTQNLTKTKLPMHYLKNIYLGESTLGDWDSPRTGKDQRATRAGKWGSPWIGKGLESPQGTKGVGEGCALGSRGRGNTRPAGSIRQVVIRRARRA